MSFNSKKLRHSAKDHACMNCGRDDGTTVPAHANTLTLGKGMGLKVNDFYVAWLCFWCHTWLDQGSGMDPTGLYTDSRTDKMAMWTRAYFKTIAYWFEEGVVVVA